MLSSAQGKLDHPQGQTRWREQTARWAAGLLLAAALAAGPGCAALSNPLANGVPVRRLPPELLGESKEGLQRIPLTLLRQPPPPAYKLAAGDVLGIWIEGIFGEKGQPPVARPAEPGQLPTAVGFPVPIRANGTISLPQVPPIKLEGLTLEEAEEEVRKAYTEIKKIFQPGRESVIVTLQRRREYHVLVIRQDAGQTTPQGGAGVTGARSVGFLLTLGGGARGTRRGTGYTLDLPAYENDVLNALARTGGIPGSDAADEVIIERGTFQGTQGRQSMVNALQACPGGDPHSLAAGTQRIRIPLRYRPGHPPPIRPEDVVLQSGDVVFIEAREADVFYTGGLLPSGEYVLPRDTDLDVVQGPLLVGGVNTANVSGQLINPGLSFPNPTLVSIIRPTPGGKQVVIRVDLDRALRDPRERVLIQPKDLIVLQERPQEAFGRYVYEIFNFRSLYTFVNSSRALVTSGANSGGSAGGGTVFYP